MKLINIPNTCPERYRYTNLLGVCVCVCILRRRVTDVDGCIKKFPDWVDNELYAYLSVLLVENQHKGLWRQNSLDWFTK
jgi:hypothetical protein